MYKGGYIPEHKHHLPSWKIEQKLRTINSIEPEQCNYRFLDLQKHLNDKFKEFENRLSVLVINNKMNIISGSDIIFTSNNITELLERKDHKYISYTNTNILSSEAIGMIENAILKYRIEKLDLDSE